MSGTLSKSFHLATLKDIHAFADHIGALAAHKDFASQYDALPEDVTQGKTFTDLVYDDLLSNFTSLVATVPVRKRPYAIYKQLLHTKNKKTLADKTVRTKLNAAIAELKPLKLTDTLPSPEFPAVLRAIAPEKIQKILETEYIAVLHAIHNQIFQRDEDQPFIQSQTLIRKLQGTFHSSQQNATLTKAEFKDLVDQAYIGKPKEEVDAEAEEEVVAEEADEEVVSHHDRLKALFQKKKDKMTPEAQEAATTELRRLKTMGEHAHEFGSTIDYIEFLLALPWKKESHKKVSLKNAERKLNKTHYGMKKVKERVIEFIATHNNGGKGGSVLALDGPPGVGKTSIGKSLADAMGRKFVRISMGGFNDQTIIRGHGRTYSGSKAGAILLGMKKAGVTNPVIALDEIDKACGNTEKGNVSAAMLEVLDPEQNNAFEDHYLKIGYDLSDVIFVGTSNNIRALPDALVDRMEIISLTGYTVDEKMEIAKQHIIPKQLERHGLTGRQLKIKDDVIRMLIEEYTEEGGVRKLEECIKKICDKKNVAFQKNQAKSASVSAKHLVQLIGPPRIHKKTVPGKNTVGRVTGLYWSQSGGGIIPIQVSIRAAEKFNLVATGMLGKSLDESTKYALELLQQFAPRYGISNKKLRRMNIHIHFTDAATDKDGPSAGAAIATALVSALTKIPTRREIAMTGEVDLDGNVTPIGGLDSKLEGARRAGATTVLIPWGNQHDLYDVPDSLKAELTIIPVKTIDDVFRETLVEPLVELEPSQIEDDIENELDLPSREEFNRVMRYIGRVPDQAPLVREPQMAMSRSLRKG